MSKSLPEEHEDMVKHGGAVSLTVSPEALDAMTTEEFSEFWESYGKIVRLLSKIRARLNRVVEEPGT